MFFCKSAGNLLNIISNADRNPLSRSHPSRWELEELIFSGFWFERLSTVRWRHLSIFGISTLSIKKKYIYIYICQFIINSIMSLGDGGLLGFDYHNH